jgi:hypothetical protein
MRVSKISELNFFSEKFLAEMEFRETGPTDDTFFKQVLRLLAGLHSRSSFTLEGDRHGGHLHSLHRHCRSLFLSGIANFSRPEGGEKTTLNYIRVCSCSG